MATPAITPNPVQPDQDDEQSQVAAPAAQPDQSAQAAAPAQDPSQADAQPTDQTAQKPLSFYFPQGTNMISPDGSQVKQVPQEQIDDAKAAGWEPAAKMQYNQSVPFQSIPFGTKKWVPASQLEDARNQNWVPVISDKEKQAIEDDSIKPSVSGNAMIMAAPLAVPEAVGEAIEGAFEPVAEQLVDKGGLAQEYVEYYGKQAGQKVLQAAGQAANWIKTNPKTAAVIYYAARKAGIPLPKMLDMVGHLTGTD